MTRYQREVSAMYADWTWLRCVPAPAGINGLIWQFRNNVTGRTEEILEEYFEDAASEFTHWATLED